MLRMHFTKKEIYGVISIVVVIIVVVSGIAIYSNLTKNTAPVPLSKYVKISNNDLLSNGQDHIYFLLCEMHA